MYFDSCCYLALQYYSQPKIGSFMKQQSWTHPIWPVIPFERTGDDNKYRISVWFEDKSAKRNTSSKFLSQACFEISGPFGSSESQYTFQNLVLSFYDATKLDYHYIFIRYLGYKIFILFSWLMHSLGFVSRLNVGSKTWAASACCPQGGNIQIVQQLSLA